MEVGGLDGWFQGVGTVLAVSVALYYSQRQQRELSDERLRSLFSWAERDAEGRWSLVINNLTPHPVQRWSVTLVWGRADGVRGAEQVNSTELGLLLPGMNRYAWPEAPTELLVDSAISAEIEFIDATGRAYRRSASDGLVRLRRGIS